MIKLVIGLKINLIKVYGYLVSPLLGNNCRYLTSCSEYYIKSLMRYGLTKGTYMGIKRILSCHPIKFLGGGSSLDLVPKNNELKRKHSNGQ